LQERVAALISKEEMQNGVHCKLSKNISRRPPEWILLITAISPTFWAREEPAGFEKIKF